MVPLSCRAPSKNLLQGYGSTPGFEADVCDERVHDVPKESLHGGYTLC